MNIAEAAIMLCHCLKQMTGLAGIGKVVLDYFFPHIKVVSSCKDSIDYVADGFGDPTVYRVSKLFLAGATMISNNGSDIMQHLKDGSKINGWKKPPPKKRQNISEKCVKAINAFFEKVAQNPRCIWVARIGIWVVRSAVLLSVVTGCAPDGGVVGSVCVGALSNYLADKSSRMSAAELENAIWKKAMRAGAVAGMVAGTGTMVIAATSTATAPAAGFWGTFGFTTTVARFGMCSVLGLGCAASLGIGLVVGAGVIAFSRRTDTEE